MGLQGAFPVIPSESCRREESPRSIRFYLQTTGVQPGYRIRRNSHRSAATYRIGSSQAADASLPVPLDASEAQMAAAPSSDTAEHWGSKPRLTSTKTVPRRTVLEFFLLPIRMVDRIKDHVRQRLVT